MSDMTNLETCKCGKPLHNGYPLCEEPDQEDFVWAEMPCLILRHPSLGYLNGYVGLHRGHPYYQTHYDAIPVEVHGGLTFGENGDGDRWPQGFFWVGFDTGHVWDISPYRPSRWTDDATYRTIGYVRQQTQGLAVQLATLAWQEVTV